MRQLPAPLRSGHVHLSCADETYVYRAYCLCEDLLYVGIAGNLFTRLTGHARTKAPWELKAARLEWDLYPSRVIAQRVEAQLIRTLDPIYNVQGRSLQNRRPRWQDLPELLPPPSLDDRARAAHRRFAMGDRL